MNIQKKERIRIIKNFIGDTKYKTILDIGVNNVILSDEINAKKILKLDIVKEATPDILCDLNKDRIALPNESIDIIIAGEILEHLNNPGRTLREFNRILKNEGILIITVPNVCSLINRFKMLIGQLPGHCAVCRDSKYIQYPEKHQNDFNLKTLKEIIINSKFKIERVSTNGIITHSKRFPMKIRNSFGEVLIVKAIKENKDEMR